MKFSYKLHVLSSEFIGGSGGGIPLPFAHFGSSPELPLIAMKFTVELEISVSIGADEARFIPIGRN
ncbi:MAG: hypothetical protein H0X30_24710 [Anaerolineae bacterium]|nr:hypothetical protein [Anaerolineae bacterium]